MSRKSSRFTDEELAERRGVLATEHQAPAPAIPDFTAATPDAIFKRMQSMSAMHTQSEAQPVVASSDAESGSKPIQESTTGFAVVGQVLSVPLDLIDPNPQNSRSEYTTEEISNMVRELELAGKQLSNIKLEPHEANGGVRYYCIDGYTRVQAMRLLDYKVANAEITSVKTPLQRYTESLIANNATRHTTDYDNGMVWSQMLVQEQIERPKLIEAIGDHRINPGSMSKILSIVKLPVSVRHLVRDHKHVVGYSYYYLIYQLHSDLKDVVGEERAEELVYETMQRVVTDPTYTVQRLESDSYELRMKFISQSNGSDTGNKNSSSEAPSSGPKQSIKDVPVDLMRKGRSVGKIVLPPKGGLKINLSSSLPENVVKQIYETVVQIIEAEQQA